METVRMTALRTDPLVPTLCVGTHPGRSAFTSSMSEFWKKRIPQYYNLGQITRVTKNHRGYTHSGYKIETNQDGRESGYFLKCYRHGTGLTQIRFAHALLERLDQAGFRLFPHPVLSMNGKPFEMIAYPGPNGPEQRHIAIYGFLPGNDKYEWNGPVVADDERRDAARALAIYHTGIFGWRVPQDWNAPNALEKVPGVMEKWREYATSAGNTAFDRLLRDHVGFLLESAAPFLRASCLAEYQRLPKIVIHGDYHPGNLKYADGKVSAVLDFDYANTDARLLDVALAVVCFCGSGDSFDKNAAIFLKTYDDTLAKTGRIGPLNLKERAFLPDMIALSNLHIVNWIIESFYAGADGDCLTWLRNGIELARRLEVSGVGNRRLDREHS